jgi:transcriptional regulator with XRE-family HTH domain
MSFLNKLELLMKEKNIDNINQLSKETGIPYTTIDGFYKKGTENIKLSTLRKLADYFNCSLDYLTDDKITERNENKKIYTLAAHHDGEEWTEEELQSIEDFKNFIKNKRNNKK